MTALRVYAPCFRHSQICALLVALLSLTLTAGCAEDTGGRVPVAGTVTLDGSALDRGTIEFHPINDGTVTGGSIRDGRFEIPATQGATPGEYEVRIYAADEASDPVEDPNAMPGDSSRAVQPELIPERYNVNSELTAQIEEGGSTDLSFDLEA